MEENQLLHLLSDGELHSGQELAGKMAVSRTAVWKRLKRLEARGVRVDSVRGHGYRLASPLDLLQREQIMEGLDRSCRDSLELDLVPVVDSTNDYLKRAKRSGARFHGCLAEQQTAGRGRHGRDWVSPFGCNLYLSLAFDLAQGLAGVEGLSIVAGIAVHQPLREMGLDDLRLKWPNDLMVGQRKLGGILIELQGEAQGRCRIVLGLGLNVLMSDQGAADLIGQPWTSLVREQVLPPGGRSALAARVMESLMKQVIAFEDSGFGPFRERFDAFDLLRDQPVRLVESGEEGIGRGLAPGGGYQVEVDGSVRTCQAGELSLRVL